MHWASQVALVVKNLPVNVRRCKDVGSVPGLGRSPGGGHGNAFQYLAWRIPMDREVWRGTIHGVAKSWTRLK